MKELNSLSAEHLKYLNPYIISDFFDFPIHIVNAEGIIMFVNKSWSQTYKMSRRDAVGNKIQDLIHSHLHYFLSMEDRLDSSNEAETDNFTYNHFKEISTESTALRALSQRKKVSMVTNSLDGNRLIVTSIPVFSGTNEIVYVFTFVQNLTRASEIKEQLEYEIRKNQLLSKELNYYLNNHNESSLIGNSKKMEEIKTLIPIIAKTDAAILIHGESGVGKEVFAKEIFKESLRADKPFITINCAAIPDNLLESEMFGYEKGAFTGAVQSKIGLFELANGGTIMLDEIGAMPLTLQPKLLRVLQENEFMRVGGTKKIQLNVRIIAATNEKLMESIKSGLFRKDLYYRLNVIPVELPPLRDRKEDIRLLSTKFLEEFNDKYQRNKYFNEAAFFQLEQHDWPGNIRELRNTVERLVIVSEKDVITDSQILSITKPEEIQYLIAPEIEYADLENIISLKDEVQKLEFKLIRDALITYKTTYSAAKALGTTQSTIVRKAHSLGIVKDWE